MGDVNPLRSIKKIITSQNLRKDLEVGRSKSCSFASIYLSNPFIYQKKYQLVDPFPQPNCFTTPNGRKRIVKALLHPCSYSEDCLLCRQTYTDKLDHLLTTCPRISDNRKELNLRLSLYNYPLDHFPLKKTEFLKLALKKKVWRNCLTKFLVDTNY